MGTDSSINQKTLIVGPAVGDARCHAFQNGAVTSADKSGNATHD